MSAGKLMSILLIGLAFVLVLTVGWWMFRWQNRTAERILQDWATQQQMTVLERHIEYSGANDRYASNKQIIYRIKVKDRDGRIREGKATIGSEKLGLLEPRIEVQLDPQDPR